MRIVFALFILLTMIRSTTALAKPTVRRSPQLYAEKTGWLHDGSSSKGEDASTPPSSFKTCHAIPCLPYIQQLPDLKRSLVTSHTFTCPLDHDLADESSETITVHATIVDVLPSHVSSTEVLAFLNAHTPGTDLADAYSQMFHDPEKAKVRQSEEGTDGLKESRGGMGGCVLSFIPSF